MSDQASLDTAIVCFLVGGLKVILTPLVLLLRIVYFPCQILVLPLMVILLVFSLLWVVCMGVISLIAAIARSAGFLRPILFVLVLPFVLIGAVLVVLAPMPSPASLIDQQTKFHFLLSYPRCEVL